MAVDAVLRLKGSGDLSAIQIIKKKGGCLEDSFLDEGKFLLLKLLKCTDVSRFWVLGRKEVVVGN